MIISSILWSTSASIGLVFTRIGFALADTLPPLSRWLVATYQFGKLRNCYIYAGALRIYRFSCLITCESNSSVTCNNGIELSGIRIVIFVWFCSLFCMPLWFLVEIYWSLVWQVYWLDIDYLTAAKSAIVSINNNI